MNRRPYSMTSSAVLATALAAAGISGFSAVAYAEPTTPERLVNAVNEPQNWLMNNQSYAAWRNSHLDIINRDNVANLHVAFMVAIGGGATSTVGSPRGSEQSVPLAEDGIIYLTDSHNKLMAFDVRSGTRAVPLWRSDPQVATTGNPRGISLFRDNVYQSTADARLIAVNKESGETVFDVSGVEPARPELGIEVDPARKFVGAPVLYRTAGGRDIILQGSGGAGVGWFGAFDASTGEVIWRTDTIPLPGQPGHETWADDHNAWRSGRVMPWHHPSIDVETNTVFWGTGEPSPVYDPEFRPGDNLFSISTVALDADTGRMKWYFQEVPNDQWDHDSIGTRMIFPFTTPDGVVHRAVSNWARNSFFYTLDVATGEFLQAVPVQDNINWTAGIDPKTGKPVEYTGRQELQTYQVAGPRWGRSEADAPLECATWGGAPTFFPPSYDDATGITYQTATEGCTYQTLVRRTADNFNWLQPEMLGGTIKQVQINTKANLIALDVQAGRVVARHVREQGIDNNRQAEVGTLLTHGGLVFTGWKDGTFGAYDKTTLEELWTFNTGTDLKAAPITYAVDGKQYVAHIAGGSGAAGGIGSIPFILPAAILVVYGL